ncbi:MAG: hypothetical protein IKN63_06390 [Bacilli bacterium]|nr:hypothetical protein [Bacilli bacterium]
MQTSEIIAFVTFIVTFILGFFSKKSVFIRNELIPIQNILIGLIVAIVEWIITKDFKTAIALSGILAGGTYDIFHNLEKILRSKQLT